MANLNESFHHAIIKAYDAATESLKTTITNASIAIDVSAIADSIAIADDSGNKVTTTLIGSKRGLDVNVADITLNKSNDSVSTESFDQSTRIDEASSSVSYFGFAEVGSSEASAVWKIKKMSTSGSQMTITYADGNSSYDNIWANRASLSYS